MFLLKNKGVILYLNNQRKKLFPWKYQSNYHIAPDKMSGALFQELHSRKYLWISEQERSLNDSQSVIEVKYNLQVMLPYQ